MQMLPNASWFRPGQEARTGEVICCVGDSIALEQLLKIIPDRVVTLEPSPSRALKACLEDEGARLMLDLANLDPSGLSALVQFRMMRPDQEIILLGGSGDARHLNDSSLEGLPIITVPRERAMGPLPIPPI